MEIPARFLRRAILVLVIGSVAGGVGLGTAGASPITFTVHGVFDDGGDFAGTFVFDPQQPPSPPNPPFLGFVGPFSIISTKGSIFGGFDYLGAEDAASAQITPPSCGVIQFSFAELNQSQLVIAVPGFSFATFNGGPLVNTCPGSGGVISFEQLFPPSGTFRTVTSGVVVSEVPEPATSVLMLVGLTTCVYTRFRHRSP